MIPFRLVAVMAHDSIVFGDTAVVTPKPKYILTFTLTYILTYELRALQRRRIMAALDSNEVTEKTLAAGLSAAVNEHDAEAVKEESSTVGRGTHTRQVRRRRDAAR